MASLLNLLTNSVPFSKELIKAKDLLGNMYSRVSFTFYYKQTCFLKIFSNIRVLCVLQPRLPHYNSGDQFHRPPSYPPRYPGASHYEDKKNCVTLTVSRDEDYSLINKNGQLKENLKASRKVGESIQ